MTFPKSFYRWRPHPWHGLSCGPEAPQVVHAYIEVTPYDVVKYEITSDSSRVVYIADQDFDGVVELYSKCRHCNL